MLYVSGYLKQHQRYYYQCLTEIRSSGNWEQWIAFFLEAVTISAEEAQQGIIRIATLFADDRKRILSQKSTSVHSIRLFEFLPTMPKLTVDRAVELLEVTYPTANTAVISLVEGGVLVETSGRARHRSYEYSRYVELLRE